MMRLTGQHAEKLMELTGREKKLLKSEQKKYVECYGSQKCHRNSQILKIKWKINVKNFNII